MKHKPFDWDHLYKPSEEEIKKERWMIEMHVYYGIPIGVFNASEPKRKKKRTNDNKKSKGGFCYTKDELRAMQFIIRGKALPDDLANRLLATKEERSHRLELHDDVTPPKLTPEQEMMLDTLTAYLDATDPAPNAGMEFSHEGSFDNGPLSDEYLSKHFSNKDFSSK